MFLVGPLKYVRYSHPDCRKTGVYEDLDSVVEAGGEPTAGGTPGARLKTLLAVRDVEPRLLVFLEKTSSISTDDDLDPYARYAEQLGLHPIAGDIRELAPDRGGNRKVKLCNKGDHLALRHGLGEEYIPLSQGSWLEVARQDRRAFVIAGVGLRLDAPTEIFDTLAEGRRCWGGAIPYRHRSRRLLP
jgi:hypothetical protein